MDGVLRFPSLAIDNGGESDTDATGAAAVIMSLTLDRVGRIGGSVFRSITLPLAVISV